VAITGFLALLWVITRERFYQSKYLLILAISGLFLLINILYFTNLIPPIPLALKEAGVFHSIVRDTTGNYTVTEESRDFFEAFTSKPTIHLEAEKPVYVFTSIFSPTALNTTIIHRWQHYDEKKKSWITMATIRLPIIGGREEGFRTYSLSRSPLPGSWRVIIENLRGQDLGLVSFAVVQATTTPELETLVY
jgi:hypothetical protein